VLPALDAVLAEPAVRAADRIVLTGDIAAGPQPGEVLGRLTGLGDRVTWVRGNADRELVELARGETDDVGDPVAHWALLSAGAIELRRTAYDVPAACALVCAQSSYPDVAEWTDYFLHSRASDADALAVMAPRDGRPSDGAAGAAGAAG
jgi:hypothetical protein